MLPTGTRVLVAVSGGPDSVGLLSILAALRRRLGIVLIAGHVNHHLRGADSDADEECAAAGARQLGIDFVRADLPPEIRLEVNIEARARELRYAALRRLAMENRCSRIATGHTRDDQAETVLLRLIRGTGPGALAGIQPIRADGVIRPLIDCSRDDVEAFARAAGQIYRIDATNHDERFLRTRVRRDLIPLLRGWNPAIVANLAHVARLSAAERTIVQAWTADTLRQLEEGTRLDTVRLATVPAELQRHIVRAWLVRVGVRVETLTARHVSAVTRLAVGRAPSGTVPLRDAVVRRQYRWLEICHPSPAVAVGTNELGPGEAIERPAGWRIEVGPVQSYRGNEIGVDSPWAAVCDATHLVHPFTVRAPRPGERVRPLGLAGHHRKLSDLFIDRKVPATERRTYPVVSYGNEILWIPGITRSDILCVHRNCIAIVRLRASRTTEPVTDGRVQGD